MIPLGIIYVIGLLSCIKALAVAEPEVPFSTVEYLYTALCWPYVFLSVIMLVIMEN